MRLALLLYHYFPHGGVQRDCARFARELLKRGHQCRIYVVQWEGEALDGVELHRVPVSGWSNARRNQRFSAWVQRDLAENPVDGVVGFDKMPGLDVYYAADSCLLDRALAEQRRGLCRRSGGFRHAAARERAVFAAGGDTEILLLSASEKARYVSHYQTDEARLHLLPPGISRDRCYGDDAAERRRAMRARFEVEGAEHVLLFLGNDFVGKGLDRAIRALARAREAQPHHAMRLLVAGRGRERRFRRLAKKLGVKENVHFLGGRDDVPDLLLAADTLVHPARYEPDGVVLLEALVAGLPVIATDVCGYAHHIVDARAGMVLRSPFQQEDLDDAVLRTLDGVYRHQCRETGLVYAHITDLYSMHQTGAELIERLVAARVRRRTHQETFCQTR